MKDCYPTYFCKKCKSKYYISHLDRCEADFTAHLTCPRSSWLHKHPALTAYSHDEGITWSLEGHKAIGGNRNYFMWGSDIGLLKQQWDAQYQGYGHAHRLVILNQEA